MENSSNSYDHSEKGFFHKLGKITSHVGASVLGVIGGLGVGQLAVSALSATISGAVGPIVDLGLKGLGMIGGFMAGNRVVNHQYAH